MLYIGSDHLGYDYKKQIKASLKNEGIEFVDLGVFDIEEQADYPDIAREVAEKIAENPDAKGILIGATGVGMMMAANKVPGVRATVIANEKIVKVARQCNDANIACFGTKVSELDELKNLLDLFLTTEFGHEGHDQHCLDKLENNK